MSIVKKKYTIWQTLKEGGFYRVFHFPDFPNMWGEEKKLTYKHNQINRIYVNIVVDENKHIGQRQFDDLNEAHSYWLKVYGQKQ